MVGVMAGLVIAGESGFETAGLITGGGLVVIVGVEGFVVGTVGRGVVISAWVVEIEPEQRKTPKRTRQ